LFKQSVEPAVAEELNAALARALGGDTSATDAERVLRLLGTRNHKSFPSNEVGLVEFTERRHDMERGSVEPDLAQAAEGIRTLDLLHGKQNPRLR